jgi:hypothetical protein
MAKDKPGLEAQATYGGAVLVNVTDEETKLGSPVRAAATVVAHLQKLAVEFEDLRKTVKVDAHLTPAGQAHRMGEIFLRLSNEIAGIDDGALAQARRKRDELAEQVRAVPVGELSPVELALVPVIHAKLAATDPLLLPALLRGAAANRDRLTVAVAVETPPTFALVDEELATELRETMGGRSDPEAKRTLARLRELITAAETLMTKLRQRMMAEAGLKDDPLKVMAGLSTGPAKPKPDPLVEMARGKTQAA